MHGRRAQVPNLAHADDVVKRLHRLFDRGRAVPAMNLVEVDVVRPESLQARVDFVEDRLARETSAVRAGAHPPPDFRGDDDLLAPGELAKHAAGNLLACSRMRPRGF